MNVPLLRLRARSTRRHFANHRAQLVLALIGVSIGVAAVVAVEIARTSVRASFEASLKAAVGAATHRIVGRTPGMGEESYAALRRKLGWLPMAPIVDAQVIGPDDRPWRLLGVDLIREEGMERAAGRWREISDFPTARWFGGDPLVLLPEGAEAGDGWSFTHAGRRVTAAVAGRYPNSGPPPRIVLADIGTAQRWLGRSGRIDRVEVVADAAAARGLRAALPAGLSLVRENRDSAGLSRAFELNLTALSLLTALVGVFIVYNTFSFLVLQRRDLYALEYSLGASPKARRLGILAEAAAVGMIGGLAGIVLGVLLGWGALSFVQQTVSNLYYDPGDARIVLGVSMLGKAIVVGLGGCLIAGWGASRSATRASVGESEGRIGLVALIGLVAGLGLLLMPGPLLTALAGVFGVALGYALLGGPLLAVVSRPLVRRVPLDRLPLAGLGARRVPRSLDRTLPAVAALTLAVATVSGVGLMIDSFRTSVAAWLGHSLSADYYLAADSGSVSPDHIAALTSAPGVAGVSRFRLATAQHAGEPVEISIQDLTAEGRDSYQLLAGDPKLWRRFDAEPVALVTENLARLRGIAVGDDLLLETGGKDLTLTVVGVIRDYRTGTGRIIVSWPVYASNIGAPEPTSIGLYLAPSAGDGPLERVAADLLDDRPDYRFASTALIRERSLEIFDQTFRLTRVMQWIAAVVALVGLTGALLALQLERRAELLLLAALGLTPEQQRRTVRIEAFLLGGVVALFALPLSALLAWSLTAVINPRAFGWRLGLVFSPAPVLLGLAIAVVGAWFAGLVAARHTTVAES